MKLFFIFLMTICTMYGATLTEVISGASADTALYSPSNTITVNSGGTLLLGNSNNQYPQNTNLTLNGGQALTFGYGYQDFGKLTLSADSTITFLSTSSFDLYFNNSSINTWSGVLTINGWSGDATGGIKNSIYFSNQISLTPTQLSQIRFSGFGMGATILPNGELVPMAIPEMNTVVAAALLLLIVIIQQFKSLRIPARF